MKQIAILFFISLFSIVLPGSCKSDARIEGYIKAKKENSYNKKLVKVMSEADEHFIRNFDPSTASSRETAVDWWKQLRSASHRQKLQSKFEDLEEYASKIEDKYYYKNEECWDAYMASYSKVIDEELQGKAFEINERVVMPPAVEAVIMQVQDKNPDAEVIKQLMATQEYKMHIIDYDYIVKFDDYELNDVKISELHLNPDAEYEIRSQMQLVHKHTKDRKINVVLQLILKRPFDRQDGWELKEFKVVEANFVSSKQFEQLVSLKKNGRAVDVVNNSEERLRVYVQSNNGLQSIVVSPHQDYFNHVYVSGDASVYCVITE